ncbi:MAG: DEAD/DEAH box helicase [Methanoregulaceae archaeon]|nr:DEAD/DEAH box helicase [Methanoregulaceae archaeon]
MSAGSMLHERVRDTIKKRGFSALSAVQAESIPIVLRGDHLLLIAPTGTGKTESAMLPVFHGMISEPPAGFRALYITPLRSLNRDMLQRLEWWCKELGLRVGVRHGDTPAAERRKQALSPPDLLITTPETVQALFMGKVLRKHLANVRYVIVDEIHELAGSKRGSQLAIALERLTEHAGEFQRIGLSATVGNPGEVGKFLCGERRFSLVSVPVAKQLRIAVEYVGENFERQAGFVADAIDRHGSTLIFVNTRVTAEALGHILFRRGDVEVHHGSLSKEVRIDAEERFKKGEIKALICTSSMELGIDIGHVGHVIQFGSPREVARLVQRVGRAGHQLHTVSRGTILALGFDDLLESLVITRKALAGEIEGVRTHIDAADVLANQIAAMAVEYGEIQTEKIRRILARSAVFSGDPHLVDEVSRQMEQHRLIRLDGERVVTTSRARRYLASNLSMIHDERKVPVFDMVSRRTVATLDESFVVGWVQTGAVFITKGQLWRVLDMEDGRITVEPAKRAKGELPSWEGEQIPVPYDVAREVGALRRTRDFGAYSKRAEIRNFAAGFLEGIDRNRQRVPTDGLITLEDAGEGVVMHVCAGHRANEALARSLSTLVSARFGSTVGIEVDAYRVFFTLPRDVKAADVRDHLLSLDPEHIGGILRLALRRTVLYKWKLVQIAKKFGAIDPDADYERLSIHRLTDLFDGTVIQKEAYRELFGSYMDVAAAAEVVRMIRDKEVDVVIAPLSVLGAEGLFSSRDQIQPPGTDQAVIATLKRRLDQQEIVLGCMNCRSWKSRTQVARVPERPQCPNCGARLIAVIKPYEEEQFALANRKRKTEEERSIESRLLRNANIVLSSGKKAVIALSAKGVGPEIASRILGSLTGGDDFYREILKAERNFIRTHRFW